MRVQLIGKSEADASFSGIIELANAADGPAVAKGSLGIVEIDFYEAAP